MKNDSSYPKLNRVLGSFSDGRPVTKSDVKFVDLLRTKLRVSGLSMSEASRRAGRSPHYLKKIMSFQNRPSFYAALSLMEVLDFTQKQANSMQKHVCDLPFSGR